MLFFTINYQGTKSRGYSNLYNSKIVSGGMRLRQNRVALNEDGEWHTDVNNYTKGWKKIHGYKNIPTCWQFRSMPFRKYFGLCMYIY